MWRPEANANIAFARQVQAMDVGFAPLPAAGGGAAAFSGLMQQVQQEVQRYIADGDSGVQSASAVAGMSPEALARFGSLSGSALSASSESEGQIDPLAGPGVPADARQRFLARIAPWAEETGAALGVAPHLVAAHAALESGWGSKPLRGPDGRDAHNLFGIKARGQAGQANDRQIEAMTTEYDNGVATQRVERFRRYEGEAESFRDYARLLRDNPRYHGALNTGNDARAFANALARGGYATDPAYANKLMGVAASLRGAFQSASRSSGD